MATSNKKTERTLIVTKSHDGHDLGDRITVVGEPDERTTALIGQGYFEWAGDEPAAADGAGHVE